MNIYRSMENEKKKKELLRQIYEDQRENIKNK